ncbi:MAG TPA: phospholipid carrier-dependent glycosyltransferase [Thermoplasmata archaeon]|nr:phospholipid carrier-dependent glycosyltransferase [Thermoplasmata archaeon]
MSLLASLTETRRRTIIAVLLVLALAAALRLYNIGWSYSNNGVDEGVMLQRALLISRDYDLYTDIPCDQAPLAFYFGALLKGDVVTLRALNAALSVAAIAACMFVARKIGGDVAMVATGVFLAVDFAFVRESRLFSLDGMAAYLLAFALLSFYYYAKRGDRLAVFVAGLFVGLSTAVKLLGGLGLIALVLFFVLEAVRERSFKASKAVDLGIMVGASAVPLAIFMVALGPSEMLQGMLFDQAHREFEPLFKLSILAYLGLILTYILPIAYARELWGVGPEVRYLIVVTGVILAFMILNPLVFFHHMVLLSPALAILGGFVTAETVMFKKGHTHKSKLYHVLKKDVTLRRFATFVIMIDIAASMGLAFYGVAAQGEPSEIVYAEKLRGITGQDDWVISGDPLIATYADRQIPPEVVNVAYRRYPQLTLEDLEQAIEKYNVSVVVLCFRLKEIDGFVQYLRENNFTMVVPWWIGTGDDTVLDLFEGSIDPTYFYVKVSVAEEYDIPTINPKSAI